MAKTRRTTKSTVSKKAGNRTNAAVKNVARAKATAANRIKRYAAEKQRMISGIGKAFRPAIANLIDELHEAEQGVTPHLSAVVAFGNILALKAGKQVSSPEDVERTKRILKPYETNYGLTLEDEIKLQGVLVGTHWQDRVKFEFLCTIFQSDLVARLGEVPPIRIRAFLNDKKGALKAVDILKSTDIVGLDLYELEDLRIAKQVFDTYWAHRSMLSSLL